MEALQEIQEHTTQHYYDIGPGVYFDGLNEMDQPARSARVGILNAIGFAIPIWSGIIYLLVKLIS